MTSQMTLDVAHLQLYCVISPVCMQPDLAFLVDDSGVLRCYIACFWSVSTCSRDAAFPVTAATWALISSACSLVIYSLWFFDHLHSILALLLGCCFSLNSGHFSLNFICLLFGESLCFYNHLHSILDFIALFLLYANQLFNPFQGGL